MKILLFLFVLIFNLFASVVSVPIKYNGVATIPDNHKLHMFLDENIYKIFDISWDGNISIVNNRYLANGKGYIKLIRREDKYKSPQILAEIDDGHLLNNLSVDLNNFYKCLDSECLTKEYKGKITYIEDINKTKKILKTEPYSYKGELKIDQNENVLLTGFGKVDTNSSSYIGELKDSSISGYGIFKTKPNAFKFQITQQGFWDEGHFKEGYIETVYADGGVYKGDSKNGLPDGEGVFIWSDGSQYIGYFKKGKKEGKGKYIYSDGSVFVGSYKDDKKNGYGELFIKPEKTTYKGNFSNGLYDGVGELDTKDGSIYLGTFKNGIADGTGLIIDKQNKIIETFAYNGLIQKKPTTLSLLDRFLQNFPTTQANAGILDWVNSKIQVVSTAIHNSIVWVKKNKEHLINAAKGCLAGASTGAAVGATTGAITGAIAGSVVPGAGNVVGAGSGAIAGAIAGGLNGCINQGIKAFEISKANGGKYTLSDAFKAMKEEISVENAIAGSLGAVFELAGLAVKSAGIVAKIATNPVGKRLVQKLAQMRKVFKSTKVARRITKLEKGLINSRGAMKIKFKGRTVISRNVYQCSKENIALMLNGNAPKGLDNKGIELHHLKQQKDGILVEMLKEEHGGNYKKLHRYTKTSEITDRNGKYGTFRNNWWKSRAANCISKGKL